MRVSTIRMAILTIAILMPLPLAAQTDFAVGVGVASSLNMGEIGPSPVFKSVLGIGDKFKFENNFELSSMDKYTKAGWYLKDGIDILIYPSESNFFIVGGGDFRHRDGGAWIKEGIRVGGGIGYGNRDSQYRFVVKDKIYTRNDNIEYSPYFEFLARGYFPLGSSNWSLMAESELGFFKYIQNDKKRAALYSNTIVGLAYKW